MNGRWFGFGALIILSGVALTALVLDDTVVASIALGSTALGVVAHFILNLREEKRSLDED
jgi:hypothetical protein